MTALVGKLSVLSWQVSLYCNFLSNNAVLYCYKILNKDLSHVMSPFQLNIIKLSKTTWSTVAPSYKATPSAIKKWPYKVISWGEQLCNISKSQCIWNLAWQERWLLVGDNRSNKDGWWVLVVWSWYPSTYLWCIMGTLLLLNYN